MYLVFDIGGTNMRLAVSADGKTLSSVKIVPTPKDFNEGIRIFKQVADELSGEAEIKKIAGGVAGPLDKDKTMLVASPHIGGWIQKPFKKALENVFNIPILLEHEADLEGLAEVTLGAGQGQEIVASVILGTGVATTRIVKGKIDNNSLGFEAGHQIIVIDGSPCDCGGTGHLESYVSGSGIEKIYGMRGEKINDPRIWDKTARYLAAGLNNIIVHWSPDMVILGGVVMKSIPIEAVRNYLKEFLTIFPTCPEIALAQLEDSSCLYGALALLR